MKTSELTGAALDWAVAKCEGEPEYLLDKPWRASELLPHYSTDWSQGGPIIERERIRVWAMNFNNMWEADFPSCDGPKNDIRMPGKTPLLAAMRCYVASKLGDEVEVPNELV
jgi:hypothetical protein